MMMVVAGLLSSAWAGGSYILPTPDALRSVDTSVLVHNAEPPQDKGTLKRGWHADITVGTDVPVDIGARLAVETPIGLRLFGEVGGMPQGYQTMTSAVAGLADTQGRNVSAAVDQTMQSAFSGAAGLSLRPMPNKGLVADVGWRRMNLRGEGSVASIASALGYGAQIGASAEQPWTSKTTMDQVITRVGWMWEPAEQLIVRLDVGAAITVAADTSLATADGSAPEPAYAAFAEVASAQFDQTLRRFGHLPTVGFSVGWRPR